MPDTNALEDFAVGTAQEHLEEFVDPEVLEAMEGARRALGRDMLAKEVFTEEMFYRLGPGAEGLNDLHLDDPQLFLWLLGLVFHNAVMVAAASAAFITLNESTRLAMRQLQEALLAHPDAGMSVMNSSAFGLEEVRRNPAIVIVSEPGFAPTEGWAPAEPGEA